MSVPTYDLTTIKRHAYVATFGTDVIAPLASTPMIEADSKAVDSLIYENGGNEAVASLLVKNDAMITLETKNIGKAMSLLSGFAPGEDLMASSRKKTLTFTPVATGEKTLVFPAAYLQPNLSYVPAMGSDHTAKLVFKAKFDTATNALFTFA